MVGGTFPLGHVFFLLCSRLGRTGVIPRETKEQENSTRDSFPPSLPLFHSLLSPGRRGMGMLNVSRALVWGLSCPTYTSSTRSVGVTPQSAQPVIV
jgi:hypothetical protein